MLGSFGYKHTSVHIAIVLYIMLVLFSNFAAYYCRVEIL